MERKKRLVFGVGINDAPYDVTEYDANGKQIWMCPFYFTWRHMLARCYSEAFRKRQPWYEEATTDPEWLLFSNFKSWMQTQDWEGRALDKDMILLGNTHYSADTCCFLPQEINNFLTLRDKTRENTFVGTTFYAPTGRWKARVNFEGKRIDLGYHATVELAHQAWIKAKIECAQKYIVKYENETSVKKCLTNVIKSLEYALRNNKPYTRETLEEIK